MGLKMDVTEKTEKGLSGEERNAQTVSKAKRIKIPYAISRELRVGQLYWGMGR